MRRRVFKIWDLPSNGVSAALIIMAVLFIIGALAGCTLVSHTQDNGEVALSRYLEGYFAIAASEEMTNPDFLSVFWKSIRWPMLVLCFGLTPLGLIGIPILFLVRSFLLSFSISSFFHVLGLKGLVFSFFVFGITGLVYIPTLFILGVQSFFNAGLIAGRIFGENRRISGFNRTDFFRCCVCFVVIIVCCLIEFSVGAPLLESVAGIVNKF